MSNSKKIFLVLSLFFFIILAILAMDIANRTTFPGKKEQVDPDTVPADTLLQDNMRK